jgi:hypothetical protein
MKNLKNTDKKLTSVRVHPILFEKFKEDCKADKFTFQKLAERSIFLYLTDEEFKNKIKDQLNILL